MGSQPLFKDTTLCVCQQVLRMEESFHTVHCSEYSTITHLGVIGPWAIVSPWPCTHQPDCQAWSRPPRVSFCIPMHIVEQLYLLFMESFQVVKILSRHEPFQYKMQWSRV